MEPQELCRLVRQQPFEPFRIHVSDGTSYDVMRPEEILIAQRWCHVGLGANSHGPFQRIAVVANIHITRVESIEAKKRRSPVMGRSTRHHPGVLSSA